MYIETKMEKGDTLTVDIGKIDRIKLLNIQWNLLNVDESELPISTVE
jgi:hypothetical protein